MVQILFPAINDSYRKINKMKKNGLVTAPLVSVAVIVLLWLLGFGIIGIVGLAVILFFGAGSLTAGIISIIKPSGERNWSASISLILFSPFFVWFGYTMLASDFYTPLFAFLNDPTNIIYNPGGPIMGFIGVSMGVFSLVLALKQKPRSKSDKNFKSILAVCSTLFIIVGSYSFYQDFSIPVHSNSSSVVVGKSISKRMLKGNFYQTQYLSIKVDGEVKNFFVSSQIYHLFNTGDKVTITYKQNALKTITLSK